MLKAVLCTLAIVGTIADASAQSAPQQLRLVTEDVGKFPAAVQCGLSKPSMESSVRSAMRYNRVAETQELGTPIIYTLATPLILSRGLCVVSYRLEISRYQYGDIGGPARIYGSMVFCSKGGVMTGDSVDMRTRLNDALKTAFDDCLSEIAESVEK